MGNNASSLDPSVQGSHGRESRISADCDTSLHRQKAGDVESQRNIQRIVRSEHYSEENLEFIETDDHDQAKHARSTVGIVHAMSRVLPSFHSLLGGISRGPSAHGDVNAETERATELPDTGWKSTLDLIENIGRQGSAMSAGMSHVH